VILRVANNRFNYIKTKPLHLSQRIISVEPDFANISINVKINNELISLILSFGPDVEVIAPASLRKMIANSVSAMSYHYPEDKE
jgi:predicted DNA-binding transcriptional regulator YafY